MTRTKLPDLSLTQWAVLALIAEEPAHGFAVARELAPDGDLGQIWTVPRPIVYRALADLEEQNLIERLGAEASNRGPVRTRMAATRTGKAAVNSWLTTPVRHVRELRTQLLLQFRFLDRRGRELSPLARVQLEQLTPILGALREQADTTEGFAGLLARWRYESAQAAARILEGIIADPPTPPSRAKGGHAPPGEPQSR